MTADETIVIERSPAKLLLLVAMGVLMTAVSAAMIFFPSMPFAKRVVGYFGVGFFGLCTCVALWRLLGASGPVITISPQGIWDRRVAAEPIPWSTVAGISTWQLRRQKVMVLAMKPGAEERLDLTRMARWTRGANRALGADGLCISAIGTKIDHDTLVRISRDYLERKGAVGR
jgi:hypothetical protein